MKAVYLVIILLLLVTRFMQQSEERALRNQRDELMTLARDQSKNVTDWMKIALKYKGMAQNCQDGKVAPDDRR